MKQLIINNRKMQDYDFIIIIDEFDKGKVIQKYQRVRD